MSMHGGPMGRFGGDVDSIREKNAKAPKIAHLGKRIFGLFAPHKATFTLTISLILISAGLSIIPPLLIQEAFNVGLFPKSGNPDLGLLTTLVWIMIGIYVLNGLLGVAQTYLTSKVGNQVMGTLRVKLFDHLQSMELAFFTKTKTGVIQSRLQNDVGGVASVLSNTVSTVVGNTVTVLAAVVAMLILSWPLTIVAMILLPLMVLMQRKVGQVRGKIAGKTQESLSEMSAITQEALGVSGILLAKSFGRQKQEVNRYALENQNQIKLQIRQTMSGQGFFTMVQIFLSSIPAVIYLVAGWLITHDFLLTAGTVVAFTTAQSRLMFPLMGIMQIALDLQTSKALFARIFEYLDLVPAIREPEEPKKIAKKNLGKIRFNNVVFSYPESGEETEPTLKGISFEIEPNQYAAFVGPSGSGKTTIAYLIPRFYDATSGSVEFAGIDVKDLSHESLTANIGIVNQETYLFYDSIKANIAYAKPNATQKEIEAAAKAANIHETIMSFPAGYDTMVGERGYRLSGGEKQRIAIARVLLKNPPVVILDEATSAMDTVSERIVQETLDNAITGRTTIAIAHRLSTVVKADVIFVIKKGQIVEKGTHRQLMAKQGYYFKLVSEQTKVKK
ncbi:MAG: ABC transporter ATP-binding protein [Micrococcales bacterium]|nr:ABC transporter ATP-binding protein [Micrococcales bacterium]NBR55000.1 ABC transporter ATP-binding protein [Micrococcales bacterium]NBY43353.1 ABC transporter ATP-binding protein [Micrococcales bacterium]